MASMNHLDDLLNKGYTSPEYGAVLTQSQVSTPTAISSVTLTTTGAPGMIGIGSPLESFKIVAVNDANNTISLAAIIFGTEVVGAQTDFVLGFNPNGSILISPNTQATIANAYATGESSIADSVLSILSPTAIVPGMTETFTASGSTTPPGLPPIPSPTSLAALGQPSVSAPDEIITPSPTSLGLLASSPGQFIR